MGPDPDDDVRLRTVLATTAVLAAVVVAPPSATAAPVCDGPDKSACNGRTFPEPSESQTALTFAETVRGLESLEAEFPDMIEIEVIGTSFDGHDLLSVELTDESAATPLVDRPVALVSQSIHGNEPGGREGGVRYLEDVVRDPAHPAREFLDDVRLVQLFLNPDGWAAGDHDTLPTDPDSAGVWVRGNGNGAGAGDAGAVDLNRQFPWRGWIPDGRTPLSEPESQALVDEVERRLAAGERLASATDIHGEVDEAGAWILLPSGEFDLVQMLTSVQHANAIDDAVTDAVGEDPLLGDTPAAIVNASSEFGAVGSGGSGSGFLGDWLAQPEGGATFSTSTIELLDDGDGPGVSSTTFDPALLQFYRDAVAPIMQALVEQAAVTYDVSVQLRTEVGYVRDPAVTMDPILDEPRSAMHFFDDLDPYVTPDFRAIAPHGVAGGLDGLRDVIVPSDVIADDAGAIAALRSLLDAGGQVILTDTGVRLLPLLDPRVEASEVATQSSNIAALDIPDRSQPLLRGLRDRAFLTTEPATLGYRTTGGGDTPTVVVDQAAVDRLGGTTLALQGGTPAVTDLPSGAGRIRTIGTLLPPPIDTNRILYGLNDHAVLDTGYQLLGNMLDATLTVATQSATDAVTLDRVAGRDRIDTSVRLSGRAFTSAEVALVARADAFPDALAGAPLAAELDAPLLLVDRDRLRPDVEDELRRLGVDEILLLGGESALSAEVEAALGDVAATTRLAGGDRHATAARIAAELADRAGDPRPGAVLVRSDDFPDALAAGVLAADRGVPILLSPPDALPDATRDALRDVVDAGATVVVAGGTSALSTEVASTVEDEGFVVDRVAGEDRYDTAVALTEAAVAGRTVATALVASGTTFPDALGAGPAAVALDGVLLLTDPQDLDAATATGDFLTARRPELTGVTVVGGTVAVSENVERQLRQTVFTGVR